MLNRAEKRLVAEWMDLGGQYYNDPFNAASGVRSVTALSETTFETTVFSRSCRAPAPRPATRPIGSDAVTATGSTSFRENRFVLTGSVPKGTTTLDAVDDLRHLPPAAATCCSASRRPFRTRRRRWASWRPCCRRLRPATSRISSWIGTRVSHPMTLKTTAITLVAAAAALAGCGGGSGRSATRRTWRTPAADRRPQAQSSCTSRSCINPIYLAVIAGSGSTNTCSASGLPRHRGRHRRRACAWCLRRRDHRPFGSRPTRPTWCARWTCTRTTTPRRASP